MRKTIKQLEAELTAARDEASHFRGKYDSARTEAADTKQFNKQLHAQFADLKERLATAEAETQRMRGYIQRVQEDDTVREELVTIGETGGEQQLVPKRKPTSFNVPSPHSNTGDLDDAYTGGGYGREQRRKSMHWVRY